MGTETIISLFPPRLRKALVAYDDWDSISEIRLRREKPLSLTHFGGNLFLDEQGFPTTPEQAIRATEEEIRSFVCSFCRGNIYRYFENLREGFVVNEEGYRLGLSSDKGMLSSLIPEQFEGINLRIPRCVLGASSAFLDHFHQKPLSSTLLLSAPGAGKTTLLRDLALKLSLGTKTRPPLRVSVIDERRELFPQSFSRNAGLCDVLSGYTKKEGLELALRLFSPQAILCDEIGSEEEAVSLRAFSNSGCLFFATAHANSLEEAARRPHIKSLLDARVFSKAALLKRKTGSRYESTLTFLEAL